MRDEEGGEAGRNPGLTPSRYESANSCHHSLLHDAAALAVDLDEEHNADDQADQAGHSDDGARHEGHHEGLGHGIRRAIDSVERRVVGQASAVNPVRARGHTRGRVGVVGVRRGSPDAVTESPLFVVPPWIEFAPV